MSCASGGDLWGDSLYCNLCESTGGHHDNHRVSRSGGAGICWDLSRCPVGDSRGDSGRAALYRDRDRADADDCGAAGSGILWQSGDLYAAVYCLCVYQRAIGTPIDWKSYWRVSHSGVIVLVCGDSTVWRMGNRERSAGVHPDIPDMAEHQETGRGLTGRILLIDYTHIKKYNNI